jgi:hypothetical protein
VNGAHAKLQAAALRCLVGKELTDGELDALAPALESEDARVQTAVQLMGITAE